MDWLLEHLEALQDTVCFASADLLWLEVDLILFATGTSFEKAFEDGRLAGTAEGLRKRGHSTDARPDLPQGVIGMAVTNGGLPVKLWVWPGGTHDQAALTAEATADLAGWRLNSSVSVVDTGFTSSDNREVRTSGGSGFIIAEKVRGSQATTIEARLERKTLMRTSEMEIDAADLVRGYKAPLDVERGWRDLTRAPSRLPPQGRADRRQRPTVLARAAAGPHR